MSVGTIEQPRLAGDDGAGNIGDFDTWRAEMGDEPTGILQPAVTELDGSRRYEMGRDGMPARTGRLALVPFRLADVVAQYGRVLARFPAPEFVYGDEQIA